MNWSDDTSPAAGILAALAIEAAVAVVVALVVVARRFL